nr:syntaxin-18 isoform X2 [Chelonoidis abingdonii]
MSEYIRMTDTERDQIDQDAQIFMRTCADAIQQLRTEGVCKLYSEQRAVRVKRMVDKKRLSRLEPEQRNKTQAPSFPEKNVQNSSEESEEKLASEENKDQNLTDAHTNLGLWGDGKGEDELSPEEIQMFEQENKRLVGEMNSLFDEVRQIEGKVVEISRLQEIFTEKVLQQDTEIDTIHQLVVGATENIKGGNEDIREVMLLSSVSMHFLLLAIKAFLPKQYPIPWPYLQLVATLGVYLINNSSVGGTYLDHLH